jgi:hypothetical protein
MRFELLGKPYEAPDHSRLTGDPRQPLMYPAVLRPAA